MKSKKVAKLAGELLAGDWLLITAARQDGQSGILRKAWIASGELAEKKCGTAVGFDRTRMNAIGAEALAGRSLGQ